MPGSARRKKQIVVIEDNPDLATHISSVFNSQDFSVHLLNHSTEVISQIKHIKPSLIVLEIRFHLPQPCYLANKIRSFVSVNNTPLILISTNPDIKKVCCQQNFSHCFVKPFSSHDFLDTLDQFFPGSFNI